MIRRRRRGSMLAAALCFFLVSAVPADPVRLDQFGGGELVLEAPAARIVTLAPHLAELAYLAGAGDRLVATVEYSDFPEAARELPRIGDAFRFDLERLVALEPDLVVAWASGNPDAALAAMDDLGLQVWRTETRSVADMAALIRALGAATGGSAAQPAKALETRWARLRANNAGREPVRYFFQVAARPLYTVNGDHLISQGLDACGGRNVFHDLPPLAPQIGPEAVLQADPDVLLAGRHEGSPDPLASWREWPRLAAVRDDALYTLPSDLINRATPRLLDAVEQACTLFDDYRASRSPIGSPP